MADRLSHFRFLIVAAGLLVGARASAQSVDYGALEQLFGEPVTMSVTGKPQRVGDAPANIEIITQDDIRRSGAVSIPDVLRFVTGIDVRENGMANAEIGIRGYNQTSNPHLMVLIDGRQAYMVDYGRVVWAALPVQLDEIRQIEVIKGPNSALYGFNAVDGVINIITFDPLRDRVNVATLRAGTQDYLSGSVVGSGRIGDRAGLRLSLGGFDAREFPAGPLGTDDRAGLRRPFTGTFNATGRWQVSPSTEIFVEASAGDTRVNEQEPTAGYAAQKLVTSALRIGINSETPIGLISLSAYRNDAAVWIFAQDAGVPASWNEYQTTYFVQATDLMKLGTDHTVRLGLEYRQDADDSGTLAFGTISNSIFAASAMWDWQVTPNFSVTNAVRLDMMRLHYAGNLLPLFGLTAAQYDATSLSVPSFNSGLVWRATADDAFRLSIARGVQLPTLLQYAAQVVPGVFGPLAFSGQPGLRPSLVWNAELDYDRSLAVIASTLRLAVFAQRTDDILSWPFGAPVTLSVAGVPTSFSSNVGYSTDQGLEIALRGHNASGLRWNASYALAATTDHTALNHTAPPLGIVEYAHSAPEHVVIGGLGYTRDRLELDLLGRWQSSFQDFRLNMNRTALQPVSVDNYVTFTARAGYRLNEQVTVAVTGQQLNQASLIETAGPPMVRRLIASVTVRW